MKSTSLITSTVLKDFNPTYVLELKHIDKTKPHRFSTILSPIIKQLEAAGYDVIHDHVDHLIFINVKNLY